MMKMAIKRAKEIREMDEEEMEDLLSQLRNDLAKENAAIASGTQPENPGKIKEIKKTIARTLTIKNERGVSVQNE